MIPPSEPQQVEPSATTEHTPTASTGVDPNANPDATQASADEPGAQASADEPGDSAAAEPPIGSDPEPTRDTTPPEIVLDAPLPAEHLSKKRSIGVAGAVSEDCTLTLNGKPVRMREGRFRARLRLTRGENRVAFVARDVAGNEGRLEHTLTFYPRRAGLVTKGTWWEPTQAQLICAQREKIPLWFKNELGMRFVLVPPGSFQMGSPKGEAGRSADEAQHTVRISAPFYMAATEVTNREYARLDPDHGSGSAFGYRLDGARQPATQISYDQARAYAETLSKLKGRVRYRLPTEAEWEYACRAETTTAYFWGDYPAQARAYCNGFDSVSHAEFGQGNNAVARRPFFPGDDGFRVTAPAGSLRANPWGLYNMLGNVDEWVADTYADYRAGEAADPRVESGAQRIGRAEDRARRLVPYARDLVPLCTPREVPTRPGGNQQRRSAGGDSRDALITQGRSGPARRSPLRIQLPTRSSP